MTKIRRIVLFLAVLLLASSHAVGMMAASPHVNVLTIKGTINPVLVDYVKRGIEEAEDSHAEALIIQLDTPGGLDTAMRDIIQKELNAPIPVVVYVFPKGARAASAGALICLAADVAAMAPGTNIGAAHPVAIGPGGGGEGEGKGANTMVEKVTNDAVAYARSIARERGRNEEWAAQAVSKSISTPADEALEKHVIDIVAENMDDLLLKLDGRLIKKGNAAITLTTKQARIIERPMDFRTRLLSTISNPNVAYILMLIGLAGIYFELSSPGAILPGIIGGISLILAFFAFQTLPVNYAGVALILLAVILFFAEIKVPSYGLLTVGGIISMVFGSLLLFRNPELYAQVSMGVIVPITLFFAAFFTMCVYLVVKVHRSAPSTGAESLVGEKAHVYAWNADGTGKVFAHGEYWNARGPLTIKRGDIVEVERVEGMTLTIKPRGEGA